jgi:hypothetical protein
MKLSIAYPSLEILNSANSWNQTMLNTIFADLGTP